MRKIVLLLVFVFAVVGEPGWILGQINDPEWDVLKLLYEKTRGENWTNEKKMMQNWMIDSHSQNTRYGITLNATNNSVEKIVLKGNNLVGILPPKIEFLKSLTVLDLSDNSISGNIPEELTECINLKMLDLSNNKLDGPIPETIGKLQNLEVLILNNNDLSGPIPEGIGKLKNLKMLILDNNNLDGSIPAVISNLNDLEILHLESNKLKGDIPTALRDLSKLRECRLRWNCLASKDETLTRFLKTKEKGDWAETQTVPPDPGTVKKIDITDTTITLQWRPISHIKGGGYLITYWEKGKSEASALKKKTDNIRKGQVKLINLKKNQYYYYVIQSWSLRKKGNEEILSVRSRRFQADTRGFYIEGSIKMEEEILQDVTISASEIDKDKIEVNDGYFRVEVKPKWTGTITPVKEGYSFTPKEYKYKEPVSSDEKKQNFTAEPTTIISGRIIYKDDNEKKSPPPGIGDVEITFESDKNEKIKPVTTGADGSYKRVVPYKWTGTLTPRKGVYQFKHERINPVTKKKEFAKIEKITISTGVTGSTVVENIMIDFLQVKGAVMDRKGKNITDKKVRINIIPDKDKEDKEEFNYLKKYTYSGGKGKYAGDIPYGWSGKVKPAAADDAKTKLVFYPSSVTLSAKVEKDSINFTVERDFTFFALLSGNYTLSQGQSFKDIYGSGKFSPELIIGYKFSRDFFLWGGYGIYNKSGESTALAEPSRWKQEDLSFGIGYNNNLSILLGWQWRVGGMWVSYSEEMPYIDTKVSGGSYGLRIETALVFKITDRFFSEFILGYIYASDSIDFEGDEASLHLGGIRGGISLGIRF